MYINIKGHIGEPINSLKQYLNELLSSCVNELTYT